MVCICFPHPAVVLQVCSPSWMVAVLTAPSYCLAPEGYWHWECSGVGPFMSPGVTDEAEAFPFTCVTCQGILYRRQCVPSCPQFRQICSLCLTTKLMLHVHLVCISKCQLSYAAQVM